MMMCIITLQWIRSPTPGQNRKTLTRTHNLRVRSMEIRTPIRNRLCYCPSQTLYLRLTMDLRLPARTKISISTFKPFHLSLGLDPGLS